MLSNSQGNAMSSHWMRQQKTNSITQREKGRKEKKKKKKRVLPPRQRCDRQSKTSQRNNTATYIPSTTKHVRNERANRSANNNKNTRNTLQAAATGCATSSADRFYHLFGLVLCYPVCRFVSYCSVDRAPPPEIMVEELQTNRNRLLINPRTRIFLKGQ